MVTRGARAADALRAAGRRPAEGPRAAERRRRRTRTGAPPRPVVTERLTNAALERVPDRAKPGAGLVVATVRDIFDDRVPGLAAEIAFYLILSLPPLLLTLLGLLGYIGEAIGTDAAAEVQLRLIETAGQVFTDETISDVIEPTLENLLARGRADVAGLGVLFAVWSASRAVNVVLAALVIAYDLEQDRRAGWRRRIVALALTFGAVVIGLVVVPLLSIGPRIVEIVGSPLGLDDELQTAWTLAYYPVLAVILVAVLTTLYHLGTPWSTPWARDLPGALLALAGWLAGSLALRVYLAQSVTGEDSIYQSFAAPLAVLLWLYVLGFAVLVGAELNAEIERAWPTRRELQ